MRNHSDNVKVRALAERAKRGDREAFASLIQQPVIERHLDKLSTRAARQCNQDQEDVREIILSRMYAGIGRLRDPSRLKLWLDKIAERYSLSQVRKIAIEKLVLDETERRSREGKKRGGQLLIQSGTVLTPEEELLQKEREALIKKAVIKATRSFPVWLVSAWAQGKSAKEIIDETRQPAPTIYRMLRDLQTLIIDEIESSGFPVEGRHKTKRKTKKTETSVRQAGNFFAQAKAYEEVVEFIATGATPAKVISFRPSAAARERVADLINREKATGLVAEEKSELDHYMQLEHLMRLAKARAHQHVANE